MKTNIILIGFMGTGKTAVGKRLAAILGKSFYDTDQEVEAVTGMTISQLFNKYGEVRFRSEENLAIQRLMKKTTVLLLPVEVLFLISKTSIFGRKRCGYLPYGQTGNNL